MKVEKEHYNYMKGEISKISLEELSEHVAKVKESGNYKDLGMRLRWDLFWAARLGEYARDNILKYANDTHIDTALRNIVVDLNLTTVLR